MCVCLCVRGLDGEGGAGACSSNTGRNRKPSAAGGGGSRGQCQGARHQARPAGRAASGGRARRGTCGQMVGARPPRTPIPIQSQSYRPPPLQALLVPFLGTYSPPPNTYQSPYSHPKTREAFFFFFLKGPGGVGWLVDDEVSACTHRGFCLPWRVKPRLSERGPPSPDPLCCTALPGPRHMGPTWLEGPSPGLKTE